MTDEIHRQAVRKKTPSDVSDFEREQLRFFLSGDDLANTLVTINPSMAWLPDLWQMKVIQGENQVIAWIERNFAETDAICDVAANIHLFGSDTAALLVHGVSRMVQAVA
ncbi:MAG: hypothetical protein ABSA13_15695 [Beijerinckiaceae bacterium]|jgi:hypothetical protein